MKNLGWFGGLGVIQGHRKHRHLRSHMTSYSTLIETMRLSCTVFELYSNLSKVTDFILPHLHLAPT